jgi:hypothetical protein
VSTVAKTSVVADGVADICTEPRCDARVAHVCSPAWHSRLLRFAQHYEGPSRRTRRKGIPPIVYCRSVASELASVFCSAWSGAITTDDCRLYFTLLPNVFLSQPDEEYPAWLWSLLDSKATREELLREAELYFNESEGGYDSVLEKMDDEKLQRLFRLDARDRIKASNSLRSGGTVF